jgi:hypothetical protein
MLLANYQLLHVKLIVLEVAQETKKYQDIIPLSLKTPIIIMILMRYAKKMFEI